MARADRDPAADPVGVPPQAVEATLVRLEAIADRLEDPDGACNRP